MRGLIVLLVLVATVALLNPPVATSAPHKGKDLSLRDLSDFKKYKADAYLAAAAKLQTVGRDKATVVLADFAKRSEWNESRCVILLCRMLFRAKVNGEFRRPSIGEPHFFGRTECKEWPLEPIELVDGVPFFVVRGYWIGGYPEQAGDYLKYCVRNCDWSTEVLKPRTTEEKRKALAKLVASLRWKEPLSDEAKKVLSSQIE